MIRTHRTLVAGTVAATVAASWSHRDIHSAARASRECGSIAETRTPRFDASTLRQGRFVYREITAKKDTGMFTLEIRRQRDGSWQFTGEGGGQHWKSVADSRFNPRSAELSFFRKGRPYRMRLEYTRNGVRAIETMQDSTGAAIEKRSSAAIVPPTIDQRIDWASLMASDLSTEGVVSYEVFDPATGSSRLLASAMEGPTR